MPEHAIPTVEWNGFPANYFEVFLDKIYNRDQVKLMMKKFGN